MATPLSEQALNELTASDAKLDQMRADCRVLVEKFGPMTLVAIGEAVSADLKAAQARGDVLAAMRATLTYLGVRVVISDYYNSLRD